MRRIHPGVGGKLLAGLSLLTAFIALSGGLAVHSFGQLQKSFDKVASTQLTTMIAAAELRQESEILTSLAPSLFARDITRGSLTNFATRTFRLQSSLQQLIAALTQQLGAQSGVEEIDRIARAIFSNADRLATQIYAKAAAQAELRRAAARLADASAVSSALPEALSSGLPGENSQLIRQTISGLDGLYAAAFRAFAGEGAEPAGTGSAEPALAPVSARLRDLSVAVAQVTSARERLDEVEVNIVRLLNESDALSKQLNDRVQALMQSIQQDIAGQNQALAGILAQRSTVMLALGLLGLLLAGAIAAYLQISVIGRLNRLRSAVQRGRSAEGARTLLKGTDEIAEMARAVVNYVAEIDRREQQLILSQSRLTNAIEAMTDGFSLYDSDDILVTCNSRYRTLLYPGREDLVHEGQSFESIIRKSAELGMISQAREDREDWVASRLQSHRNPAGPSLQQRSDGTWIEIQEHKTESGDTLSVYTDVTERRQFIERLLEAKQEAERASEELAAKNRMLEAVSTKLSKYLDPQLYASIFSGRHSVEVSSTRKKLTIFFSDIAGFTETTDNLESEELTGLLNRYLNEMSKIALQHGATIDKFMGDAIMVFFGDPETRGARADALACVRMAIAMQARMAELAEEWRGLGLERPFQLRIGINTGFCTVGNFGSEDRVDYTIIGGEVNLAARLQAHAEVGGILIAHETYSLVKDEIGAIEQAPISVKGFGRPVRCYAVKGLSEHLGECGSTLRYSGSAGTIALKLEGLGDEDQAQLRKTAESLLLMLSRMTAPAGAPG